MARKNMFLEPLMIEGEYDEASRLKKDLEGATEQPELGAGGGIFERFEMAPEPEAEQEQESSFDIPREAIIGGVPLLIGALMGDTATGATVGGKAIMNDMDRQWQREKLQHSMAKKAKASGSLYKVYDPDTDITRYVEREEAVGKPAGYAGGSSAMENLLKRERGKKELKEEFDVRKEERKGEVTTGAFNPSQKKAADKAVKDFDAKIKANESSMRNLEDAVNSLGKGEFGDKIGFMRVVKSVEQRLSDADREFYISFINRLQQVREQARRFKGKGINPKLINQAKDVLGETINTGRKYNNFYANRFAKNLNKVHGVDMEAAKDLFSTYDPDIEAQGKVTVTNGKETYEIDASDLEDARKDGFDVVER